MLVFLAMSFTSSHVTFSLESVPSLGPLAVYLFGELGLELLGAQDTSPITSNFFTDKAFAVFTTWAELRPESHHGSILFRNLLLWKISVWSHLLCSLDGLCQPEPDAIGEWFWAPPQHFKLLDEVPGPPVNTGFLLRKEGQRCCIVQCGHGLSWHEPLTNDQLYPGKRGQY